MQERGFYAANDVVYAEVGPMSGSDLQIAFQGGVSNAVIKRMQETYKKAKKMQETYKKAKNESLSVRQIQGIYKNINTYLQSIDFEKQMQAIHLIYAVKNEDKVNESVCQQFLQDLEHVNESYLGILGSVLNAKPKSPEQEVLSIVPQGNTLTRTCHSIDDIASMVETFAKNDFVKTIKLNMKSHVNVGHRVVPLRGKTLQAYIDRIKESVEGANKTIEFTVGLKKFSFDTSAVKSFDQPNNVEDLTTYLTRQNGMNNTASLVPGAVAVLPQELIARIQQSLALGQLFKVKAPSDSESNQIEWLKQVVSTATKCSTNSRDSEVVLTIEIGGMLIHASQDLLRELHTQLSQRSLTVESLKKIVQDFKQDNQYDPSDLEFSNDQNIYDRIAPGGALPQNTPDAKSGAPNRYDTLNRGGPEDVAMRQYPAYENVPVGEHSFGFFGDESDPASALSQGGGWQGAATPEHPYDDGPSVRPFHADQQAVVGNHTYENVLGGGVEQNPVYANPERLSFNALNNPIYGNLDQNTGPSEGSPSSSKDEALFYEDVEKISVGPNQSLPGFVKDGGMVMGKRNPAFSSDNPHDSLYPDVPHTQEGTDEENGYMSVLAAGVDSAGSTSNNGQRRHSQQPQADEVSIDAANIGGNSVSRESQHVDGYVDVCPPGSKSQQDEYIEVDRAEDPPSRKNTLSERSENLSVSVGPRM